VEAVELNERVIDRDQVAQQIVEIIIQEGKIDRAQLTSDATIESLALKSIDLVMILMALEQKFGVYIPIDGDLADAKNLNGFVDLLAARVIKKRA
jgi:acyl carrier protein